MLYKKINVELIVVADEADAVAAELNAALDRLEQKHVLFGGGIETVGVEHQDHVSDPPSRVRWPQARPPPLLSGLHATA